MTTDFFNNKELIIYLKSLLSNKEELDILKTKSYIHENNFVKIPFFRTTDKIVRLHIWHLPEKEQNPHSHGWMFKSKILKGSFKNTILVENPESENIYNKNCIDLKSHKGMTQTSYLSTIGLSELSSTIYKTNELYEMNRSDIHEFLTLENLSITIVEIENIRDDVAFIYSKKNGIENKKMPNLTIEALENYLKFVIANLE